MKKLSDLSLETITIIQLSIAAIISLLFQFVFPLSWHPLDVNKHGDAHHGDPGTNLVIFTLSQWYFSLSVAWFIYRDNPIINNFIIYSTIPFFMIVFYEFIFIGLYYDYIHILPLIVDIWILWKKRDKLTKKYFPEFSLFIVIWFYIVFFLQLAYYQATLLEFTINIIINISIAWVFAYLVIKSKEPIIIEIL